MGDLHGDLTENLLDHTRLSRGSLHGTSRGPGGSGIFPRRIFATNARVVLGSLAVSAASTGPARDFGISIRSLARALGWERAACGHASSIGHVLEMVQPRVLRRDAHEIHHHDGALSGTPLVRRLDPDLFSLGARSLSSLAVPLLPRPSDSAALTRADASRSIESFAIA